MELARTLGNNGVTVTLLESGVESFESKIQNLHKVECTGRPIRSADHIEPYCLEDIKDSEACLRQFGGSVNIWSGKWKMLDPFDFEKKLYVKESAWPID